MSDIAVKINSDSLFAMQDLLQEQFLPTLEFCLTEFDRLQSEVERDFEVDITASIRHAHSLKSNAAQFGAESLAELAKDLEHALGEGDMALSQNLKNVLPAHISATKEAIQKVI
ncbi:Hpt domain-containing protein [Pseudoalteromonas sp.]|uniref:Hpt domain-containing protein n=1 Tax=Pseudoalteromonas sp. TaxID=53249 RepID=UPI00356B0E0D